jgi:hypothetical protein
MTLDLTASQIQHSCEQVDPDWLADIEQLVLFVGHAHSGHSIIGATLDAHPDVAIANEINLPKLIREHRLNKQQIESVLLSESFKNAGADRWHNSEYTYGLEQSWQGKTRQPTVIGDKKAGGSTRILVNDFWVLEHLLELYGAHLKVIFVQRRPLDIVAAYAYYMKQPPSQFHVDRYLENLATVRQVEATVPDGSFITVDQRTFVEQSAATTAALLNQLGLQADPQSIAHWVSPVRSDLRSKAAEIDIPANLSAQLPS